MILFKEINALRGFLQDKKQNHGLKIGFVPTMGALHEGHLSLIKESKKHNDITVCSVFVNPTQFNNDEDLAKYPRPIEKDLKLLTEEGCDVLFYPEVKEMYFDNETRDPIDYGNITEGFEGEFRPGHFDGVVMIVKKLFAIVNPDNTYLGQKDFQQCLVIEKLISKNNLGINLVICSTIREKDGLAMSSRNTRMNKEERQAAIVIPQTLFNIKEHLHEFSVEQLLIEARQKIISASSLLKIEYLEIVDSKTLKPILRFNKSDKAIAIIAVWCGNVRLIDNIILTE